MYGVVSSVHPLTTKVNMSAWVNITCTKCNSAKDKLFQVLRHEVWKYANGNVTEYVNKYHCIWCRKKHNVDQVGNPLKKD